MISFDNSFCLTDFRVVCLSHRADGISSTQAATPVGATTIHTSEMHSSAGPPAPRLLVSLEASPAAFLVDLGSGREVAGVRERDGFGVGWRGPRKNNDHSIATPRATATSTIHVVGGLVRAGNDGSRGTCGAGGRAGGSAGARKNSRASSTATYPSTSTSLNLRQHFVDLRREFRRDEDKQSRNRKS